MAFTKLPKLRAPEPTRVTARVINTFYKPEQEPVDGTPLLLAQGLEQFNSGLSKYISAKEEVKEEVDTKKAQADYNKNQAEFKTLVKNGKIPEGASPYYINAYINAELRDKARTFERELFNAWQTGEIKNDLNPNAFEQFYQSFAKNWFESSGLDEYDKVNIAEAFIPYAEATRSNLQSQHVQSRISIIEDNNKNLLNKEVINILDDSFLLDSDKINKALGNYNVENLNDEDKITIYSSLAIKEHMDELLKNGMKESVANQVVTDAIVREAVEQGDEDILLLLQNIQTKDNNVLASTKYASEKIVKAKEEIENGIEADVKFNDYLANKEKAELYDSDLNAFYQHILLGGKPNFSMWSKIYSRKDGSKITDTETINGLNSFANNYVNGLNLIEEDTDETRAILKSIYESPNDKTILNRIVNGIGKDYDSAKGEQLLEKYFNRQAQAGSKYYQSPVYTGVKASMFKFITKGSIEISNEVQDLVDVANERLESYTLDVITELETNSKYQTMTFFEKQEEFSKFINAEYNRIKDFVKEDGGYLEAQSELKNSISSGEKYEAPY